jgi:hypothetical protein
MPEQKRGELDVLAEIEAAEQSRPTEPTYAMAAGRMVDLRTARLSFHGRRRLAELRGQIGNG